MPSETLLARKDVREVRRALINRASEIAQSIHRDIESGLAVSDIALGKLVDLETQISSLSRLVREMEDFDAV